MTIKIQEYIPLAPLTTFHIGGLARYYAKVNTEGQIYEAISWAKEHSIAPIILAGGSNVLISDKWLNAIVIHITGTDFSFIDSLLNCNTGCNLLKIIQATVSNGFGGWEKLAGIPGTVGGAVRGNAGAFGTEIKDVVEKIRALNIHSNFIREFTNLECNFSYRNSFFKEHSEWIITRVYIKLKIIDPTIGRINIQETIDERERRHLQNIRAAGSFFVNPTVPRGICEIFEKEKGVLSRENRVQAGWLIEKVGMKGSSIGDARASSQHPNYILNSGNATAMDVLNLAKNIKIQVHKRFGIWLQEEAQIISSPA